MKWQHTKANKTLTDDQVESHIREWEESADKLEKMTAAEARRFVGGKQPMMSRFLEMTLNMQNKIRKEAPSREAEARMLEAWKRRTVAYHKIMSMLAHATTTTSTTITAATQLDSSSDNENVLNISEESLEALLSNPFIVGPTVAAVIFLILLVICAKRKKILCFKPKPKTDADKSRLNEKGRTATPGGAQTTQLRDIGLKFDAKPAELQPLIADRQSHPARHSQQSQQPVSRTPSQMRRPSAAVSASPYPRPAATAAAVDRFTDGRAAGATAGVNVSANAADRRSLGNASVATATTGARRAGSNVNVNSPEQQQQQQQQQRDERQCQEEEIKRKLTEWLRLHRRQSPVTAARPPSRSRPSCTSSRHR